MLDWLATAWQTLKVFVNNYYNAVVTWYNYNVTGWLNWLRQERDNIVSNVNSWIDWLKSRIQYALDKAWNDLVSWYNNLRSEVDGWVKSARQWATERAGDVRNYVVEIRDWLRSVIEEKFGWAKSVFDQVWQSINSTWASVQSWFNGAIQPVKDWANQAITDVRNWFNSKATEIGDTINRLWDKINNFTIPTFSISADVVWGFVEGYFYAWFEWWLACLLNDGVDPLPPKPRLIGSGASGGTGGGGTGGPSGQGFIWPVASRRISGYTFSADHKGVDIGINTGDAVWAIQGGVVENAGWSDVGYGFMVRIAHPNGWHSLYAHLLQPVCIVGQNIIQGQMIGIGDSTGHSTGPHLHLEIYLNGQYFDPLTMLP